MAAGLLGDCAVERAAERHEHAVLERVTGERKLDRARRCSAPAGSSRRGWCRFPSPPCPET